jgi:uncharacterized repeat protein (TIGR03803 family)
LALIGGTLFGTAPSGGSSQNGTVFAIAVDGTGYTNLHSFSATSSFTNSDGANPDAALTISGNQLYGTTYNGGAGGSGAIFNVGTNGMGFTNFYSFTPVSGPNSTNGDGQGPQGSLAIAGNTIYGTTGGGGTGGNGTIFRINTDGTGFTNLHNFAPLNLGSNADGANPSAGLLLAGSILYGTASAGGVGGSGVVFAIGTNGLGFTNLYSFSPQSASFTNNDGAKPQADLVLAGSNLFGTTVNAGDSGNGTVFRLSTNGIGFTNLHSFSLLNSAQMNADGANPSAGLVVIGSTLYGTALLGGTGGNGTVFKINPDGSGFSALYSFTAVPSGLTTNSDGANPGSDLIFASNTLFSTTSNGGVYGEGTVFSLRVLNPVPLSYQLLNQALVLSWTNPAFSLQSALGPYGGFTNVPGASSPYTNTFTGGQQYFRLQGR